MRASPTLGHAPVPLGSVPSRPLPRIPRVDPASRSRYVKHSSLMRLPLVVPPSGAPVFPNCWPTLRPTLFDTGFSDVRALMTFRAELRASLVVKG